MKIFQAFCCKWKEVWRENYTGHKNNAMPVLQPVIEAAPLSHSCHRMNGRTRSYFLMNAHYLKHLNHEYLCAQLHLSTQPSCLLPFHTSRDQKYVPCVSSAHECRAVCKSSRMMLPACTCARAQNVCYERELVRVEAVHPVSFLNQTSSSRSLT